MSDAVREKFDVWVNVYPPLPEKYNNAYGDTITAHKTREDALNNAGHSCRATCLLHFNGERLETAAQADAEQKIKHILSKRIMRVNKDGSMSIVQCERCAEAAALVDELERAIKSARKELGEWESAFHDEPYPTMAIKLCEEALTKAQAWRDNDKR